MLVSLNLNYNFKKRKKPVEKNIKDYILNHAPWINKINVEIEKVPPEGHETSISIITNKKILFVKKTDRDYKKNIYSAIYAVIKKLKKLKLKKKNYIKLNDIAAV